MSLDYAADHLTAAVRSLATSEYPLAERLQTVWDEHVQVVWMKPCLTRHLLREFRDMWQRYTAPSDDRRSTKLRGLTREELVGAPRAGVWSYSSPLVSPRDRGQWDRSDFERIRDAAMTMGNRS